MKSTLPHFSASVSDLHLAVIGATGRIGKRVIELIDTRKDEWRALGLRPRIVFVASSRAAITDTSGIEAASVATLLGRAQTGSFESQWRSLASIHPLVAIDCTASADIAASYPVWLARGIDIVTPNKHASSADSDLRAAIERAGARSGAELRDSTTVGAQLPLLATLRELRRAGDRIDRFEAVLSGTLSYVLGSLQNGKSLSQSIGEAIAAGYAEPNPACDLSGEDAARKLVILLRAAGIDIELRDVERLPLLESADGDWLATASRLDETWRARAALAQARQERWIYRASFQNGRARVAPERVPVDDTLAKLAPCENALVLHSDYYRAAPLTIAGPGAGIVLTAAGVFADLLSVAERHRVRSWQVPSTAHHATPLRSALGWRPLDAVAAT
jgi:aspartokinase/homoserine dehydrogenase 1